MGWCDLRAGCAGTPADVTETAALPPDTPAASIIGSLAIDGPELTVDSCSLVMIASPLRGDGWLNANGCCDASPHRVARLAVDGNHLVKAETFAIDEWTLAGITALDMASPDVPVSGEPLPQRETLPLELDMSNFP